MRRGVFTSSLLALPLLFFASPAHALEFRVCVKPPDVPPGMTQWAYEQGSAKVWTTRSRMEFARRVEGRAVFIYDAHAPPESVRVLPIPYNALKCPPPPPKPAPAKEPPKEEKKAEDGSASKAPGKRGGDEERKGGDDEGSVEKRVEEHRLPQPKEGPPPPRASAPEKRQDPVLPREGVLSSEPILPRREAKWADKEHGLVDRGGALPLLVETEDRKPLNVTSCEQTKEGCPARKQKTRAGALLEQVVIAGAIFNLQMNEDLHRPDGKEYGIVGGMNADGPNDPRLQAAAAAVMFSPVAMALGNKFMKATSEALARGEKVVIKDVGELSEDAAKYLAEEFGEELTEALAKAEVIGPYRVLQHFTKKYGRDWQAHHVYETARMIKAGLDPLDGPCVILSKEVHQRFTTELAQATKGIGERELPKLWEAYKKVYKANPAWLKAITHYFGE
ncbi:hypothetical protein [Polyangium jinanense]|uniref:Uncharacterized protein n=1 Tax=Polyangium jinanense TaxID=2829994 RepID=A0A9X3WWU2_9BACT|nr:hypothetical protein [Polyangium jinanense]MDC3953145.1 hypothetical protein [Polyangium jinanense]MDC3979734.1 hypothetical protein [Polyangium jinanense]